MKYSFVSVGISGVSFFILAYYLGVGQESDLFFLLFTYQACFSLLCQAFWHSVVSDVFLNKELKCFASANVFLVLFLIALPFSFFIGFVYDVNFFCFFFFYLFFNFNIYAKNLFQAIGYVEESYFIDIIGYSGMSFFLLLFKALSLVDLSFVFASYGFSFFLSFIFFVKKVKIDFKDFSFLYVKKNFIKGFWPKAVASIFLFRDVMLIWFFESLSVVGLVTIYSYLNKVGVFVNMTYPNYSVGRYLSGKKIISMSSIVILSRKNMFFSFLCFFLAVFAIILNNSVEIYRMHIDWIFSIMVFFVFTIQSFEMVFARYCYLKGFFNVQIKADVINIVIFLLFLMGAYILKSEYISLVGLVVAQFLSLYIYRKVVIEDVREKN